MNDKKRTFVLSDAPSLEDELSVLDGPGPHERVAEAITWAISSGQAGGAVIGLEGVWGSGKSTIVNLLASALEETDSNCVMIFDAWAHQGDPLRRSFLETLIDYVEDKEWVGLKKDRNGHTPWQREKEELACRIRTDKTIIIPKPTILGMAFMGSSLLLPVTVPLLVKGLERAAPFSLEASFNWALAAGSLSGLPVAVVMGNILWRLVKRLPLREGWAFIEGNKTTETTTTSTQVPEPTSIEFQDVFERLLGEALGEDDSRRLVVVIDNLDRVPPSDARSVWSTLQTFLSPRKHSPSWRGRISFILPYDPSGIAKLWTDLDDETLAQSFADKTFRLTFSVPPPALSDWRGFLTKQLMIALPDSETAETLQIVRAFDFMLSRNSERPTPRMLKLMVNQLVVCYRQWGAEVSLDRVVCFIFLQRESEDLVARIETGELPDARLAQHFGPELTRDLCGLALNLPSNHALQLLLGDRLKSALYTADGAALTALVEGHGPGFWAVLDGWGPKRLSIATFAQLCNSARAIQSAKWQRNRPEIASLLESIARFLGKLEHCGPLTQECASGLASLYSIDHSAPAATLVVDTLRRALAERNSEDPPSNTELAQAVAAVLVPIASEFPKRIGKPVVLGISPASWVEVCDALLQADPLATSWSFIRPADGLTLDKLAAPIIEAIGSGTFSDRETHCLQVTPHIYKEPWGLVCQSIQERLTDHSAAAPSFLSSLVSALLRLKRLGQAEASSALSQLDSPAHFLHWLATVPADQIQPRAILLYAALTARQNANFDATPINQSPQGVANATQMLASSEQAEVAAFLEVLNDQEDSRLLLRVLDSTPATCPILVIECLKAIGTPGNNHPPLTPAEFLPRWQILHSTFGDDYYRKELGRLETSGLSELVQAEDFQPGRAILYLQLLESGVRSEALAGWCSAGLGKITTGDWTVALKENGAPLRLALWMVQSTGGLRLSTSYRDGLDVYAQSIARGEHIPLDPVVQATRDLVSILGDEFAPRARKDFLDAAVRASSLGQVPDAFFDHFGNELRADVLAGAPTLVDSLFRQILIGRSEVALDWMISVFEEDSTLVASFGDGESTIRNRVENTYAVEDIDDRASDQLERLGRAIGLDLGVSDETPDEPLDSTE